MSQYGIIFGSFQPFHRGHLSMVLQAKHECDEVYLFVCGSNGDIRDKRYDLPLKKRFRLVEKFFEDDNTIEVKELNDSEMGIDGDKQFTDEGWRTWLSAVKCRLPLDLNDSYTFYVGEPSYVAPLEKAIANMSGGSSYFSVKLVDRNKLPISGTQIRKNPIKYWDYIAQPFRGEFSTNILVLGTASEGKTHLVQDVSKYFGLVHSKEMAREVLRKNGKIGFDKEITCKDFIDFLTTQYDTNKQLINSPANRGVFISDTSALTTQMYAHAYAQMKDYELSQVEYTNILNPLVAELESHSKWDVIFLVGPHNKFKNDGERNLDQSSMAERQKNYEFLKNAVYLNYYDSPTEIIELKGTYEENFETVKNKVESILAQGAEYERKIWTSFKRRTH